MKETHRRILQLREQEVPVKAIAKEMGLAQSTVSYVLSKHFPKDRNAAIVGRNSRALNRSPGRNRNLKAMREAAGDHYAHLRGLAKANWVQLLEACPSREFICYIAGLYDGEGRHGGQTEFSLCNSDPNLVLAFLRLLREVLLLPEDRFTLRLTLHKSLPKEECVSYWEQVCAHPVNFVDQYDSRPQKKMHKHNKHRRFYGTLAVRVKDPNGLKDALKEYSFSELREEL